MTRPVGAGVFRHLVHRLEPVPWSISLHGMTFTFAACGAATISTSRPHQDWRPCPNCWDIDPAATQ